MKILVVDNDEIIQKIFAYTLRKLGFKVRSVNNGKEAIDLLLKKDFDLTFIELFLPDMSGLDVLNQVRKSKAIPIIMTAYQSVDSVKTAIERGAYDYVFKPIDPKDLEIIISRAFKRHEVEQSRKSAEIKLRDSENNLRSLFNAITDLISVEDDDYNIINSNKSVKVVFGNKVIGRKCFEVYQGRDSVCPNCPVEKAKEIKKPVTAEHYNEKTGKTYLVHAYPILDNWGSVKGVIEFAKDLSREKNWSERQKAFDNLVKFSSDPIKIVMLKEDQRIINSWNAEAEKLFGWKAEEILGKPVTFLVPPDLQKNELPLILEQVEKNGIYKGDTVRLKKDGTKIEVRLIVTPIKDEKGKIISLIAKYKDLSDVMDLKSSFALIKEKMDQLKDLRHDVGISNLIDEMKDLVLKIENKVNQ